MPRVFEYAFKAESLYAANQAIEFQCFSGDKEEKVKALCERVLRELTCVKVEPIPVVEEVKKILAKNCFNTNNFSCDFQSVPIKRTKFKDKK